MIKMREMLAIVAMLMGVVLLTANVWAEEKGDKWDFKPGIYSRGGITLNSSFAKRDTNSEDGYNKYRFNLGSWGDETNAIRPNLTEAQMDFTYGKKVRYVYGFDVNGDQRYIAGGNGNPKSLQQRLNYLEYYKGNQTYWFGQRAYRGDIEFLTGSWALDEHNMLGGGVKVEKIGPFNTEFAYGVKQSNVDPYVVDILINKTEYPLSNGKIKSNLEYHKVHNNSRGGKDRTTAYLAGLEFQRWGDKIAGGNWYNRLVANYSRGNVYGGTMQSAFNSADATKLAHKYLAQWNGDWGLTSFKIFYNLQYQLHLGDKNFGPAASHKWQFVNTFIRPVYVLTSNMNVGIDYAARYRLGTPRGLEDLGWGTEVYTKTYGVQRVALMWDYHLDDKPFDLATVRFFVGRMFAEKPRPYFTDQYRREETFVRLAYEVAI
ncbi:MAG: hypothetical protein WCG27_13480 [Pseudomonadota bacterium]